jgi:hypothetical protein
MMNGSLITGSERARELPRVTSSELADQIEKLRASGQDVVTLAGAPYWPPPEHILRAAAEAASRNENARSVGFLNYEWRLPGSWTQRGVSVRADRQPDPSEEKKGGLNKSTSSPGIEECCVHR